MISNFNDNTILSPKYTLLGRDCNLEKKKNIDLFCKEEDDFFFYISLKFYFYNANFK